MKFKSILAIGIILTCNKVFAQTQEQKDSIKNVSLTEIVISGNKFSEKKKNIVQKIK